MYEQSEIAIKLVSEEEIQLKCNDQWETIRMHDKGFTAAKRLFRIVRIAHGIACGCVVKEPSL